MNKSNIAPIAAGLVGAAVGAAAGIALSDKKKRQKAMNALTNLKEKGEQNFQQLKKGVGDLKENAESKVAQAKKNIKSKSSMKK